MSRQKVILALGTIGLLFKIILNIILISLYGYNGSAVATVLGEFIIFLCAFVYLNRRFTRIPIYPVILKPAIAGGIACLGFYMLNGLPLVLTFLLIGLVYVAVLLLLRTFDKHELNVFIENTVLNKYIR